MATNPRGGGLLFFGIHQIGVDALSALNAAGHDIAGVVTKPERPGENPEFANLARRLGLPLFRPHDLATAEVMAELGDLSPRLIVVAGYHQRIPQALLDLPALGGVNLHGSLLPHYRGPNPWKWAIMNGEHESGVTVHVMTAKMDRGDILAQAAVSIDDDDTGESLFRKIAAVGGPLLAKVVGEVLAGTSQRRPQDESQASYFPSPSDADAQIDWAQDAVSIRNHIRGFNPRPAAWTLAGVGRWRVLSAVICPTASPAPPGTLLDVSERGWRVATASQDLRLEELRQEEHTQSDGAPLPVPADALSPGLMLGHTATSVSQWARGRR